MEVKTTLIRFTWPCLMTQENRQISGGFHNMFYKLRGLKDFRTAIVEHNLNLAPIIAEFAKH